MDMLDRLLDAETNVGRGVRLVHFFWRTHMGIPCWIALVALLWFTRESMSWKWLLLWANLCVLLFVTTLLSHIYDSTRFSEMRKRYHDFQDELAKEAALNTPTLVAKSLAVNSAIERLGKWLRPVDPNPK